MVKSESITRLFPLRVVLKRIDEWIFLKKKKKNSYFLYTTPTPVTYPKRSFRVKKYG